ncbi:unnamed protein product [Clonostachys rhizophaga]|uniref:Pectate lyase n=1 Tax=Clonostachys rhizophaga TaxID=160324 RepID=A0A9N9VF94_9HYPO|nr:unnamed protein product [Clonostachys rhizophaga]
MQANKYIEVPATDSSASSIAITKSERRDSNAPEAGGFRVRLNPNGLRVWEDPDWPVWTVLSQASHSYTSNGVTFTLSTEGTTLKGARYKYVQQRAAAGMGEKMVGEAMSSDAESMPITLTIQGLSAGTHTLTTWHNAPHSLASTAALTISVKGSNVLSNLAQSIRQDNLWDSSSSYLTFDVVSTTEEVKIIYTPDSSGDKRAYLNGFEIDKADVKTQIQFPYPLHLDEHVDLEGKTSTSISWKAAKSATSPSYNTYLGTETGNLKLVDSGTSTSATFSGLNTDDYYYWRVDVVSNDETFVGRENMFRIAHLAFPGAEGHGRFARGGRGGKVVKVTTLEDGTGPGTLRYALSVATGPRTVIFDVGGVITTTSRLTVSDKYVTVAAQTAPGKGIVIQGMPVGLSGASDNIWRHMRVRPGKVSGETIDGMGMAGSNYAIFDRCSVGWTIDESFSSRSANNITLQRTLISEPLNVAGHKNYPAGTAHGYSASVGGNIGSFHHNLLAHAEGRSWSMAGGLDDAATFNGRLDFRNNVVYNFGHRVTDGGAHQVNFVGNYYKPGPATGSSMTYDLEGTYEDDAPGTQTYYCSGNSMPGVFTQDSTQYVGDGTGQTSNIACRAVIKFSPGPTYQKFYDNEFFKSYVETQTSTEAYKRVLSDVGAQQPVFDDHDTRIIQETLNGSYTYTGSVGNTKGIIDDPADAGGLEDFPSVTRDSSWDSDNDGIADWWDGSTGGEGYTPLEGYINFMAEPHVYVSPSKTVTINLAALASGFSSPSFSVSGPTKGSVSLSGSEASYSAGASAGIDYVTVNIKDGEGSTWSRKVGIAIYEGAN